jgi:RNA polymerase sigma-70 factor (ECF subfamily)
MAETLFGERSAAEATVRSAVQGDEVAFARLVAEHHAAMARVAYVICGDADVTRDAVQSAWAIAWRRMGSLRDPAQVRPWLIRIAANEAKQALRRRRREHVVDISSRLIGVDGDVPIALELADLEHALRRLSPDERSLLAMRYAAGLDSAEIARHVGLSASGVRSRLARLLDRLRSDLALDQETER